MALFLFWLFVVNDDLCRLSSAARTFNLDMLFLREVSTMPKKRNKEC